MIENTPGRFLFNTDALPERDRFPAFYEGIVRRYTALDMHVRDETPFRGSIELQRAGAVDIGLIATTPLDSIRSPELVRDGDDGLIITLCRSAVVYQTQRGYDQMIESGEAVICDCGYAGALNMISESSLWSLKVPRSLITGLVPRSAQLAGAKLSKDSSALRLLFAYLDGALGVDLTGGGRAVELYGEHIVDLIALAFGPEGDAREQVEQGSGRALRRAAVLREIESLLADPGLSAVAVGLRLGITSRYVHLLLEETGRSFTQHVLEKRLERAAALLRDPRQHDRRIADIALEAGFADLSHFNRAFRRLFGDTPSGVRIDSPRRLNEE
jgi:AraC-like DNA-binding protein